MKISSIMTNGIAALCLCVASGAALADMGIARTDSAQIKASDLGSVDGAGEKGYVRLCQQGGPVSEAEYVSIFNRCNSLQGCAAICYPYSSYVNGSYYTGGRYCVTCTCTGRI